MPVVALPADTGGVLRRLVAAVEVVVHAELPHHALIGGLAVMANLAQAHRVTADVDTVSDDDHDGISHTVALLVATQHARAKPTGDGVILRDGTKVDIIATGAWTSAALPDDPIKRMFILSHWWAVETARATKLVVLDGSTTVASAIVALAQPPALVAAKLQSMRTRRGESASKAVSDVYDTYRLLAAYDGNGSVAEALSFAPLDVGAWCAEALMQTFVAEAARWARRINDAFAAPALEPADLEVVGSLAVERIGRSRTT
ncbi:MAG: hypothetical protein NVS3B12_21410 [Acidimicrobiales bacterium]